MVINKRILKPVDQYSWNGNTGESIVLHTTLGGTYKGAEDTLKIRHLSYHYVIDKDGKIYQLVDISRSAWHAGVRSNPNLRARAFFGEDNPNRRSIGIAFVNKGNMDYPGEGAGYLTKAQRDAAVWLIKEIGKKTGVRYNLNNIFSHYEVTDYKPQYVENMRGIVVDGLLGFKDEKDNVKEKTILELRLKLLKLKLQALLRNLSES